VRTAGASTHRKPGIATGAQKSGSRFDRQPAAAVTTRRVPAIPASRRPSTRPPAGTPSSSPTGWRRRHLVVRRGHHWHPRQSHLGNIVDTEGGAITDDAAVSPHSAALTGTGQDFFSVEAVPGGTGRAGASSLAARSQLACSPLAVRPLLPSLRIARQRAGYAVAVAWMRPSGAT
jgi:hypothetical protein